jgi:GH15 family glucan-1,4-alpha-glucosidase
MSVSLATQIESAKRELAMRRSAYPKWVQNGRLTQGKADHEIAAMQAIIATLEALQANEVS